MKKYLLTSILSSLFFTSVAFASSDHSDAYDTSGSRGQAGSSEAYCRNHDCYFQVGWARENGIKTNDLLLVSDYHSTGGQRTIRIVDFGKKYPDAKAKIEAFLKKARESGADIDNNQYKLLTKWENRIETGPKDKQNWGTFIFDTSKLGIDKSSPVHTITLPATDSGSTAVYDITDDHKFVVDLAKSKGIDSYKEQLTREGVDLSTHQNPQDSSKDDHLTHHQENPPLVTHESDPKAPEINTSEQGQPNQGHTEKPSDSNPVASEKTDSHSPKQDKPDNSKHSADSNHPEVSDESSKKTPAEGHLANAENPSPQSSTQNTSALILDNTQSSILAAMTQGVSLWAAEMNSLDQRLGDLHFSHGQEGLWMRTYTGQYMAQIDTVNLHVKPKTHFWALQTGYDHAINSSTRLGLALTYMRGNTDLLDSHTKADLVGLTAYSTWLPSHNNYVDLVAKVAHLNTQVLSSSYTQWASSFSLEYGHQWLLQDNLSLTGNIEMNLGHLSAGKFKVQSQTIQHNALTNLSTRAGLKLNYVYNTGTAGLTASIRHDWGRNFRFTNDYSLDQQNIQLNGTSFSLGLAGTQTLGKQGSVYYNIEKAFKGKLSLQWRADIGVRWAF